MFRSLLLFLFCLFAGKICAGQELVFMGSYNHTDTLPGIYVYELDTVNCKLKGLSQIGDVVNPAYLDVVKRGNDIFLYACTEALIPGGGRIRAYTFNKTVNYLSKIGDYSSDGENPVYISVVENGTWLFCANYTEGNMVSVAIDEYGHLDYKRQVINFTDSSINKERQDHAHIHSAVYSPKGYLYLPDLGADKIRCFTFDRRREDALQPVAQPFVRTVPGSGPRHFTFGKNGFAYCVEEMGGAITAYKCNDDGSLDSVQRILIHPPKRNEREHGSADIHCSPDGRFLYASNRGRENNIAILSIDQLSGKLTLLGYQSVLGDHPRNFAIDPTGKFLLVANQISGDVVVFKRNMETGMLKYTGEKIKIPGASCLQIRQY